MPITFVGDSAQCIYQFRHSNPLYFEMFHKLYPQSTRKHILKNYRSPEQLVKWANRFREIFKDSGIDITPAVATKPTTEPCFFILDYDTQDDENRDVVSEMCRISAKGVKWGSMTYLVRTNRAMLDLESYLIARRVPYYMRWDSRSILNQSPFKFLYAVYSVLQNPADIHSLCELMTPVRGVGEKFLETMAAQYRLLQLGNETPSIFSQTFLNWVVSSKKFQHKCLHTMLCFLGKLREFFDSEPTIEALNLYLMEQLKYVAEFQDFEGATEKLMLSMESGHFNTMLNSVKNILQMQGVEEGTNSERFLMFYQLLRLSQESKEPTEPGEKRDAVELSTVHSYKGKENDYIFFSNLNGLSNIDYFDLEAQCVFYTGITRAKAALYLTASDSVRGYDGCMRPAFRNPFLQHMRDLIKKESKRG